MKKVLVFSDVHGDIPTAKKVINEVEHDVLLYLGDWANNDRSVLDSTNTIAVQGNNCCEMDIEFNQIIDIEDARIFMTHGHYFSSFTEYVSNKKLVAFGKEHNVDLILHGHTHVKKDDVLDGIRILNPGSLSDPRDGVKGSYITFEVDGNEINNVEFHFIN